MEASAGRCEQGKPRRESSPISGGASVSPHRGWGAWQAGEGGGGPHSSGRPPTLAELGWLPERGPGLGSMGTGGRRLMDHPYLPCSCSPHTGSCVYATEGTGRRVRSRSGKAPSTRWFPQGLRPAHTPCEEGPQEGWLRRSAGQPPSGVPRGSWTPKLRAETPGAPEDYNHKGLCKAWTPSPCPPEPPHAWGWDQQPRSCPCSRSCHGSSGWGERGTPQEATDPALLEEDRSPPTLGCRQPHPQA